MLGEKLTLWVQAGRVGFGAAGGEAQAPHRSILLRQEAGPAALYRCRGQDQLTRALPLAPLVLEVSPAPAKIDELIANMVGMGTSEGTG